MADEVVKGIFKAVYAVGTAAAVVFAPPVGAAMVATQVAGAVGTEIASNCVKDEDTKQGLKNMSEVFYVGASVGGAALGKTKGEK
jgi:hypothetical protein